ncbi:uncharacterized protein LOC111883699 [Lactuca sativa]|uniref:uncharacterized protein LOC111883699 n=1 Tax=Lactuca sativa TaxID=4236 RepID=UPI000CD8F9F4|nr:uncharacterized protein LOC111883699 [Lactuca sativa]
MPPKKSNRKKTNPPTNPPSLPPPRYDHAVFQAVVTAIVAATMSQIHASGTSGANSGANPSNQGNSQGHPRECSYKDFTNDKPKSSDGTGGVNVLTRWFEKTESIFEICVCPESSKVKFAACTFTNRALTWWNSQVKSLTLPIPNAMSWDDLKELMLAEYCTRGEMKKLEQELWNLKMKGSDIAAYTARISDLAVLCPGMTLIDHGDRQDSVTAILEQPKESSGKKKFWNKRKGQSSQDPSKKQQTVAVHVATIPAIVPTTQTPPSRYTGNLSKCNKCNFHHHGLCQELRCTSCNKKANTTHFCKTPAHPNVQTPETGIGQACYGCGETRNYKRNCPKAIDAGNTG